MDSQNKIIYDLILSKFNENTKGITFDGNYMFKFNDPRVFNFDIVALGDSLEFEYTKEVYQYVNIQEQTGLTTSIVTVNDSVNQTKEYDVSFNTTGIETFSSYKTLTENQVMNWCIAANLIDDVDADILEKKDRIINPRKYYKSTEEVKPWD